MQKIGNPTRLTSTKYIPSASSPCLTTACPAEKDLPTRASAMFSRSYVWGLSSKNNWAGKSKVFKCRRRVHFQMSLQRASVWAFVWLLSSGHFQTTLQMASVLSFSPVCIFKQFLRGQVCVGSFEMWVTAAQRSGSFDPFWVVCISLSSSCVHFFEQTTCSKQCQTYICLDNVLTLLQQYHNNHQVMKLRIKAHIQVFEEGDAG